MKKIKKALAIFVLALIALTTTACGGEITQKSLEDTYYQLEKGDYIEYFHFEQDGKLEIAQAKNGKLQDRIMPANYKVIKDGQEAKVELNLAGTKETVEFKKVRKGIKVGSEVLESLSKKEGKKAFE